MVLYYTPNLRPNDGGVMVTGQTYLDIPGGQSEHVETGFCQSKCTTRLTDSIYVVESLPHMHYQGTKAYVEHYRNGVKVTDLVTQEPYIYDEPVSTVYDTPVEFRPGDTIKTACHFKSSGKTDTTYFGDATSDEMCFAFLTYYPKAHGMKYCMSFTDKPVCDDTFRRPTPVPGECNLADFFAKSDGFFLIMGSRCDLTGKQCNPDCQQLLALWTSTQPCLRGDALNMVKDQIRQFDWGPTIITAMGSCDPGNSTPPGGCLGPQCPSVGTQTPPSSANTVLPTLVLVLMAVVGSRTGRQ